MASKNHELPLSIGRALNFTTGRVNALCAQLLAPHGLTLPQWVILSCLWREDDLTVSHLSELVGTGLPATSRILDRMEDRDLIHRLAHTEDRRAIVVRISEKGRALNHLGTFHERINDLLFEGFSPEDRKTAFGLLEGMRRNAMKALR
jgi:DNA-binding MarR family transcriptional regulator